jgi:hypothetical protein
MRMAIIHLGSIADNIASTSVLKAIKNRDLDASITCVVNEEVVPLYKYNRNVNKVIPWDSFKNSLCEFDLLINLYPIFPKEECSHLVVKEALGFGFDPECDKFSNLFFEGLKNNDMNIFQIYYKAAGMTWKGEGYNIDYYPRSRARSKIVGVSVANANLRNYILDKLKLNSSKIWYVPYRKNIFKKMDEINKCKKIITDDMTIFHLAMSLRKYVYFLKTFSIGFKMELFDKGEIYEIPVNILR